MAKAKIKKTKKVTKRKIPKSKIKIRYVTKCKNCGKFAK